MNKKIIRKGAKLLLTELYPDNNAKTTDFSEVTPQSTLFTRATTQIGSMNSSARNQKFSGRNLNDFTNYNIKKEHLKTDVSTDFR